MAAPGLGRAHPLGCTQGPGQGRRKAGWRLADAQVIRTDTGPFCPGRTQPPRRNEEPHPPTAPSQAAPPRATRTLAASKTHQLCTNTPTLAQAQACTPKQTLGTQERGNLYTHRHTFLTPPPPTPTPNIRLLGAAGPPRPGRSLPPSLGAGHCPPRSSTISSAPAEFVCEAAGPWSYQPGAWSVQRRWEGLSQPSRDLLAKVSKGKPSAQPCPAQEEHMGWWAVGRGSRGGETQPHRGVPRRAGECPGQPVAVGGQRGLPPCRAPPPSTLAGSLTLLRACPAPDPDPEPGDRDCLPGHPSQIQETPRRLPQPSASAQTFWAQALRPQQIQDPDPGRWLEGQDGTGRGRAGDGAVQSGLFSRSGFARPTSPESSARVVSIPLGKIP